MRFLYPNQTGIHPAGEKQSFCFWYRKHTAGDLRKAKRQQGAHTKSRQSARQKAGTHPANCYNRYKLTNKTRAAQPLSRHSALTRAAGFLPVLRIVPPLVVVLGMALIPPTLRHLRHV